MGDEQPITGLGELRVGGRLFCVTGKDAERARFRGIKHSEAGYSHDRMREEGH